MYIEKCENCKYQSYKFLEAYDTICPFMYDFSTCYSYAKGDISKIDAYALMMNEKIYERMHMNNNEHKIK